MQAELGPAFIPGSEEALGPLHAKLPGARRQGHVSELTFEGQPLSWATGDLSRGRCSPGHLRYPSELCDALPSGRWEYKPLVPQRRGIRWRSVEGSSPRQRWGGGAGRRVRGRRGGAARRLPRWHRGRDWPAARRERVRAPLPAARALPLPPQERRLSGSEALGEQCRLGAPARRLPLRPAALSPRTRPPPPRRAPWTCPGASWWPGRSACGQVRARGSPSRGGRLAAGRGGHRGPPGKCLQSSCSAKLRKRGRRARAAWSREFGVWGRVGEELGES